MMNPLDTSDSDSAASTEPRREVNRANSRKQEAGSAAHVDRRVNVLTLEELLRYPFPAREMILAPWLETQSLTMIHAWRGVGKTHVALNIAMAVASGRSFLNWRPPKARRVLYLDGEMPGSAMQARAQGILSGSPAADIGDYLQIVTPDAQQGPLPDLSLTSGQAAVEAAAVQADVIIVDNISTLCRATGPENEAESWRAPQEWGLRMRRQGKSVLFVHHSGKNGGQRGSSKREDILDVVIHLTKPENYTPDQGARFEIHFEKFRNGFGDAARPIEARLFEAADGSAAWEWEYLKTGDEETIRLLSLGHSQAEVCKMVNKHKSTVSRVAARARAEGKLPTGMIDRRA